ncbi:MAG: RHS repeat-associated core domain-containing protein, partial [Chlamydiae bacterium]|nr:RHS repeat-associated core domain-containing protein [Chlamydiota bacterium]
GALQSITYPSGLKVHYQYLPGRVLSSIQFLDNTITYVYAPGEDLPLKRILPNGVITEYRYDQVLRVTDILHKDSQGRLLAYMVFTYDAKNNRISMRKRTPKKETITTYVYDKVDRLREVRSSDGSFEQYTYTGLGNRKSKKTLQGEIAYTYTQEGVLTKAGDTEYKFDSAGRLVQKNSHGKVATYKYSDLGDLVSYHDEEHTVTFSYNAQGRRLSKSVDGVVTTYSYEDVFFPFHLLEEKSIEGTKEYLYDFHGCIGHIEGDKVYYYLEESPGNPIYLIVDDEGSLIEELEYDSFGNNYTSTATLRYNGEQQDLETGLIFLRNRYYDPEVGRFLTPDQAAANLYNPQSLNRYTYAFNNPINLYDPLGTAPQIKRPQALQKWARGVPLWKEGQDPPPPEGMVLVMLCVRNAGFYKHPGFIRAPHGWGGHVWWEFVNSKGVHKSLSVSQHGDDIPGKWNYSKDYKDYANDRDTIRVGMIVSETVADSMKTKESDFGLTKYHMTRHNCAQCSAVAAGELGIEEVLHYDPGQPSFLEKLLREIPVSAPGGDELILPSTLYDRLDGWIDEEQGFGYHSIDSRFHYRQEDDLDVDIFKAHMLRLIKDQHDEGSPKRGSFGGICLSKKAKIKLDLHTIYGAVFDPATEQVILLGDKKIELPAMPMDDLAVAVQSIWGLRGPPADPGITIEASPDKKSMSVTYFGATYGTSFGQVLFEGDHTLKMLIWGKSPCHISGFRTFLELEQQRMDKKTEAKSYTHKLEIVPDKVSLVASQDGSALIFDEVTMRCQTDAAPGTSYDQFAQFFTSHYEEISQEYPIFSEVKRLGAITGVVKWLKEDHVPFDPTFFSSYAPTPCVTPLSIPMEEYILHNSSNTIETRLYGGIRLCLQDKVNSSLTHDVRVNPLHEETLASRPSEEIFSWQVGQLTAEACPLVHTRKTGNYQKTFLDIACQVSGDVPLQFMRYYDSFSEEDVGLGRGWFLTPYAITMPTRENFTVSSQAGSYSFSGYRALLVRENREQYLQETKQGEFAMLSKENSCPVIVVFNAQGLVTKVADYNSHHVEYCYENGYLTYIKHSKGRSIALSYQGGKLVEARGPLSSHVYYEYSDKGLLFLASSKQGLQSYSYDEDHRLTGIYDAAKDPLFHGVYDTYNRLESAAFHGKASHYSYSLSSRRAILTSQDGIVTEKLYDPNYKLLETRAESDRVKWSYTKDVKGNIVCATDPRGASWHYEYDQENRVICEEDPSRDRTELYYNNLGKLGKKILHAGTPLQNVTYFIYNQEGQLSLLLEGESDYAEVTYLGYEENGLPAFTKLPSQVVWEREYDDHLQVRSISRNGIKQKSFTYDERNRVKTLTTPTGTTIFSYNNRSQVVEVVDVCGHTTRFFYQEDGTLRAVQDAENITTNYEP